MPSTAEIAKPENYETNPISGAASPSPVLRERVARRSASDGAAGEGRLRLTPRPAALRDGEVRHAGAPLGNGCRGSYGGGQRREKRRRFGHAGRRTEAHFRQIEAAEPACHGGAGAGAASLVSPCHGALRRADRAALDR